MIVFYIIQANKTKESILQRYSKKKNHHNQWPTNNFFCNANEKSMCGWIRWQKTNFHAKTMKLQKFGQKWRPITLEFNQWICDELQLRHFLLLFFVDKVAQKFCQKLTTNSWNLEIICTLMVWQMEYGKSYC